jgi:hypothetical protein
MSNTKASLNTVPVSMALGLELAIVNSTSAIAVEHHYRTSRQWKPFHAEIEGDPTCAKQPAPLLPQIRVAPPQGDGAIHPTVLKILAQRLRY